MFTEADYSHVLYAKLDDQEVGISSFIKFFTSVREEISITVAPFGQDESERNRQLTIGFLRGDQKYELSAFAILTEAEYKRTAPKELRFSSLGGYTIAPVEIKEE